MNKKTLFSETQRFKQIWLWIGLIDFNGFFIFATYRQVILGHQFGTKPLSNVGLIVAAGLSVLISLLFLMARLNTDITEDGIYVRFFPFQLTYKYYSWDMLKHSFVRKYSPLGEFGGWGLRGFRKNKALNVSGNRGIQIETNEGYKLLIGTNKADEATQALQQAGHWKI